ncbi:MAG: ABC transporter permease [Chloroflexota bacterium]|nr:ABC transporter permease [Chloroflexota bacterium]
MGRFIARRFLWMTLVLFLVSLVTFFLMRSVPGGPFSREKEVPPQILEALNAKYNLDAPLVQQYTDYVGDVVVPRVTDSTWRRTINEDYLLNIPLPGGYALRWMNFGPSFRDRNRTVSAIIAFHLPVTMQLGLAALMVALVVGIPAGTISALRRNTIYDYAGMSIAIVGVSVSTITSGPLLQYIFGVNLGILPLSGWGTWQHFILPAIALGFTESAIIARLTRASLLQVLHEDYVRTARAKGLRERHVVIVHTLKNALIPVITVLGPITAFLLTGSFVVERIFGVPGIGEAFVTSISDRDYPLIMGMTLLFAFLLVVSNTVVDIAYAWLDPRIRFD